MRVRTWLALAAGSAAAALTAATAVAAVGVTVVHRAHRRLPLYSFSPFEVGATAEDVEFRSPDGLRLTGWWLDKPGSQWVVVVAHSHQGSKADMLGIGPGLWRRGHSVLLFDFRGCGEADAGPQTLARDEQLDLRAALDFAAARRPDARIALVGFSMGASTAVLVGADDDRVEAFVLDSPFAEMHDVLGNAYRLRHLPDRPLVWLTDLLIRLRYGYRMGQVRPLDVAARLAGRPVLLLHGEADLITPVEHSHRLAAAIGPDAQVVTFPEAGHCWGYFTDRPGYIDLVARFIEAAEAG